MSRTQTILLTLTSTLTLGLLIIANASAAPVKLIPSGSFGKGPGSGTGEFINPKGVAGSPNGNIYVADENNSRVQEFTANGEFVLMFGHEVNATTKGDICTAASKNTCQAGVEGNAPGQFGRPESVSVDPVNGDVYVAETILTDSITGYTSGQRVQKLTPEGGFILEIGEEVNETTKGNLCTQAEVENEKVKCGGPSPTSDSATHGAFDFSGGVGNLLAVGGEHDLLYVADADKVEEFEPDGAWKHTITFPEQGNALSVSIAVENGTSELFIAYSQGATDTVRAYTPEGVEVGKPIMITAKEAASRILVQGIAIDGQGHVGVLVVEASDSSSRFLGLLFEASSGHEITSFTVPITTGVTGIGFDTLGQLVAGAQNAQQVLIYDPVPVAELTTGESKNCSEGAEIETDVTFNCKLEGTVNPYDVADTEAWFGWGSGTEASSCVLRSETGKIKLSTVEEPVPVSEIIEGLPPNRVVCYQLAGEDENVRLPEGLTGETLSLRTAPVRPVIEGTPGARFVGSFSAVMFAELNPENTNTTYEFLYGKACVAGETCPAMSPVAPGVAHTVTLESSAYGRVGVTLEARGLQPGTTYRFELVGANADGEGVVNQTGGSELPEGTFTTAPAPLPGAFAGAAGAVGSSTATVAGSVDPDGALATYSFELGVYEGAGTRYGVVFSGGAGVGTVPVEESLGLTGLQPGTTYAYRIAIASGYGTAVSVPVLFTTQGLPAVLSTPPAPVLLATPNIAFPAEARGSTTPKKTTPKCKRGKKLSRGKCVKAKKAKKAGRSPKTKR